MKNLGNAILMRIKLLLFNARPLILFEILFNVASFSILTPLTFQLFRIAMSASGMKYIYSGNIFNFLINPITITFMVIMLFFISLIAMIDITGPIYVFECSRQKKKTRLIDVLKFSFKNAIRIFIPKNLFLIFVVLILLPLISIGVSSSFIGQYGIPTNVKELVLSNIWIIIIAAIILAILIFLSMKWIFAIHYFTLEQVDFVESIKRSWSLLRGNTIRNFISIIVVQIIIGLLTKLLNMCGSFLIHSIAQIFGAQSLIGCFGIALATVAFLVLYIILFALLVPYACLKISALFYERKQAANEKIIDISCKSYNLSPKSKKRIRLIFVIITCISVIAVGLILFFAQKFAVDSISQISTSKEVIAEAKAFVEITEDPQAIIDYAANEGAGAINLDLRTTNDGSLFFGRSNKNILENNNKTSVADVVACAKENNISLMLDISGINKPNKNYESILASIKGYEEHCSIASTIYDDIVEIKMLNPKITTVYKIGSAIGDFSSFDQADVIGLDLWVIDNITAANIHSLNKRLIALEVNNNDNLEKALSTKIDGLTTYQIRKAAELNSTKGLPEFLNTFIENFQS